MLKFLSSLFCTILFAGCAIGGGLKIVDLSFSLAITPSSYPISKVSVVPKNQDKIYLTFAPKGILKKANIAVEWYYLDDNKLIQRSELLLDGDKQVAFSITKPISGWPVGNYEARILIDDAKRPIERLGFIVL